ncbi:MAG: ABC transporter permease [Blautia sp.]|nr:ABC transporter permease [Lachnoclostridium sp.]MCM1211897.1 ABC transporter permease [Blautia sp.]
MLYYEWKKIWVRPGTKIAMLLLAGLLMIVGFFAIRDVYYVNENGDHEYGPAAISKLKAAKKEWAGELTEEVIAEVIAENRRINETKEGRSEEIRESNIAYGWKQGFHDIRHMLMYAFCKFRSSDYYRPDSLVPEDAVHFYENRVGNLKEWLAEEEQQYLFSEEEREFLIARYEALEIPWQYDYEDGFIEFFYYAATVVMIMFLILGFVVAPVFSGEFAYKAEAVFYASYHGRGKAVGAKLAAAFLFVTTVYFGVMLLYSIIVFGFLGADGAGLMIQISRDGWKSFYLLTNWQEYLLIVCGGYVGVLFGLLLTMLVSAKTKSTALSVIVPFALLFIPSFLGSRISRKIIALLPDRLMDIHQSLVTFNLYSIGGRIVGAIGILFCIYSVLSLVLFPLTYQVYRKLEVK